MCILNISYIIFHTYNMLHIYIRKFCNQSNFIKYRSRFNLSVRIVTVSILSF